MTMLPPDPYSMANKGPDSMAAAFERLRQQMLQAIPNIQACTVCHARVLNTDMTDHLAWHTQMQAELKRVNPLINVALL